MNNKKELKLLSPEELNTVFGGIKFSQDFKNAFFGPLYEHYRRTNNRFDDENFASMYAGATAATLTLGTSWLIGGIYGKIKGEKKKN